MDAKMRCCCCSSSSRSYLRGASLHSPSFRSWGLSPSDKLLSSFAKSGPAQGQESFGKWRKVARSEDHLAGQLYRFRTGGLAVISGLSL